jgi:hypothetical protein
VSRLGKLLAAEKATVTCGIFSTSTSSCFCFLHGLLVLHTWIHVILGFKETKEFVSPRQFAFEAKTQIDPPRLIGCQEIVKYHASTSFSNASVAMVIRENRVFNYRSNSYRKWLAITLLVRYGRVKTKLMAKLANWTGSNLETQRQFKRSSESSFLIA